MLFLCEAVWTKVAWRGCGGSLLGDIQNLMGQGPGQPALGDCGWAGVLDYVISTGATQPHSFCYSMIKLSKESQMLLLEKRKAMSTVLSPQYNLIYTKVPQKNLLFKLTAGVFQVMHCQCNFYYIKLMLSVCSFLTVVCWDCSFFPRSAKTLILCLQEDAMNMSFSE